MQRDRPCRILLVEDNPADVRLLKEAFDQSDGAIDFHTPLDGSQALILLSPSLSRLAPRPDLILLDINLLKVSGHQVLRAIKHDNDSKRISVLVLTGSCSAGDVQSAYNNYANAYLQKPNDLKD
jgi:CheY-like chemotaxis protein